MVWVRMLPTARKGLDVDIPKTLAHRSVHGDTLMFVPGQSHELTEEEWEHIQTAHPELLRSLEVLSR